MEIRQFRVVIRTKHFERACRFYGESLALPRLQNWEREDGRGALFQAGSGVIEILGRPAGDRSHQRDEVFDPQGPEAKTAIVLLVPSAEKAYEELLFRDKNIPGGLRRDTDGALVFETHDPDGIKVLCRQSEG
jgi:catechol 2,3-dioxygenase-like lactoylglutathione lyase family enzyme